MRPRDNLVVRGGVGTMFKLALQIKYPLFNNTAFISLPPYHHKIFFWSRRG